MRGVGGATDRPQTGVAYQYSGCGTSFADLTTFTETDCGSSYDMCQSYTVIYDYEAAGYSGYVHHVAYQIARLTPTSPR